MWQRELFYSNRTNGQVKRTKKKWVALNFVKIHFAFHSNFLLAPSSSFDEWKLCSVAVCDVLWLGKHRDDEKISPASRQAHKVWMNDEKNTMMSGNELRLKRSTKKENISNQLWIPIGQKEERNELKWNLQIFHPFSHPHSFVSGLVLLLFQMFNSALLLRQFNFFLLFFCWFKQIQSNRLNRPRASNRTMTWSANVWYWTIQFDHLIWTFPHFSLTLCLSQRCN